MRLNLVLSMAVRLESGSVFPTFEHFLETFNAYCHANKELFVRKNTVTIEAANKTIRREENKFPAAWVYKAIQFQCKHYRNYNTKGSVNVIPSQCFRPLPSPSADVPFGDISSTISGV